MAAASATVLRHILSLHQLHACQVYNTIWYTCVAIDTLVVWLLSLA